MAKSIAVLGLGKFGMSLVRGLNEMGADVLAVDKVEANVKEIAASCASAVCADLSNEENLLSWVWRIWIAWLLPWERASSPVSSLWRCQRSWGFR